jgi:hypothetical protein
VEAVNNGESSIASLSYCTFLCNYEWTIL